MTRLWNVDDLAAFLGVSRSWIYDRTRREGPEVIPHFKMGKYLRFDPESGAFQDWLRAHAIHSGQDTRERWSYNRRARNRQGEF